MLSLTDYIESTGERNIEYSLGYLATDCYSSLYMVTYTMFMFVFVAIKNKLSISIGVNSASPSPFYGLLTCDFPLHVPFKKSFSVN